MVVLRRLGERTRCRRRDPTGGLNWWGLLLLAQTGHADRRIECQLLGEERSCRTACIMSTRPNPGPPSLPHHRHRDADASLAHPRKNNDLTGSHLEGKPTPRGSA